MTSLLRRIAGQRDQEERLSLSEWAGMFQFGGLSYPFVEGGTPSGNKEDIESSFEGYVRGAYKSNGVVFACMTARALLFSEARFQFRSMRNGRPGDLFGTPALNLLETPWAGATTGDLLGRAIQDADLAGNFYAVRRGNEIRRLRPDWVTIVRGSSSGSEIDSQVIGYLYHPGGRASGEDPVVLLPEQVAHFVPPGQKDPVAEYRGMSWLTPVVEEILGDRSATTHKRTFFDNGAKLGYVVTLGADAVKNVSQFNEWVAKFKEGHEQGAMTAYKTLFLGAGADVKMVGADMKQIDFTSVQGHGETRICAAARVPPIIVGLSEGLEAATYANYGQARRAFADLTMRPMWRQIAGALARIVDVPANADLWYDDRDIPFLQEDQQDAATIQQVDAITIRQYIEAGFEPASAVAAVSAGDKSLLKHTGLVSVQLQEPGAQPDAPASNGVAPAASLNG